MFYILLIILILLIFLCKHTESFIIPYNTIENEPLITYYPSYLERCKKINKHGNVDCLNSRCTFRSMHECQSRCGNGCQYCGHNDSYRCNGHSK